MQLETKHFGTVEIDEKGILTFEEGLPGFEKAKRFTLLYKGEDSPFVWLQSVESSDLAFVMVDPFAVKKDYDIDIGDEIVHMLEIESIDDVLIYAILVVPEDISKMTMNLKAPVIINKKSGKGAQIILDTDKYSVRHFIIEELQR